MIVIELWLNHQKYETDMQPGFMYDYELNHAVEFLIRLCDLTPNTHVGISIYDMSKQHEESLLASTVLDIFD